MKGFTRDSHGIPFLKRPDLEAIAEEFLASFDKTILEKPQFIPLASIMAALQKRGELEFRFDQDLGNTERGQKILGCYDIRARVVYIDRSLLGEDPRFAFTAAHELGHHLLHREITSEAIGEPTPIIRDTVRHLILDRLQSGNPRNWIEWQANKFASSLLLPRRTVPKALVEVQQALGISRNRGIIWLDNQPSSKRDLKSIVQKLSELYLTSEAATRIRLDELNLIYWPPRRGGIW